MELVNYAAKCYPGRDAYIGSMLNEMRALPEANYANSGGKEPGKCVRHVQRMLMASALPYEEAMMIWLPIVVAVLVILFKFALFAFNQRRAVLVMALFPLPVDVCGALLLNLFIGAFVLKRVASFMGVYMTPELRLLVFYPVLYLMLPSFSMFTLWVRRDSDTVALTRFKKEPVEGARNARDDGMRHKALRVHTKEDLYLVCADKPGGGHRAAPEPRVRLRQPRWRAAGREPIIPLPPSESRCSLLQRVAALAVGAPHARLEPAVL